MKLYTPDQLSHALGSDCICKRYNSIAYGNGTDSESLYSHSFSTKST